LDRKLLEKRIFPALDINKSSTRKEDLLMAPMDLQRSYLLRKVLHAMSPIDAMEFVLSKVTKTKSNADFLDQMNS
jgi:transcription termination factor Rho